LRWHKPRAESAPKLERPFPGDEVRSVGETTHPTRHEYFEHDADVGVVGHGARIEDAFVAGAEAVFALTTQLADVRPRERLELAFEEADVELAFVTWLNRLIAESQASALALGRFAIVRDGDRWRGEAWGEPWREALERGVDVKGATLTMLSVKRVEGGWEARCVVDV
jgi:SHS2 domain-containing protein